MRTLALLLTLAAATTLHARQYIQCAFQGSWDRAVISLDGANSTLFMVNGVHLPPSDQIRVLKSLRPIGSDEEFAYFQADEEEVSETLSIPRDIIGEYSSHFEVLIKQKNLRTGYERESSMGCFSSIYEE